MTPLVRRRPPPGMAVQRALEPGAPGQAMFSAPAPPPPREPTLLERERVRLQDLRRPETTQETLMHPEIKRQQRRLV